MVAWGMARTSPRFAQADRHLADASQAIRAAAKAVRQGRCVDADTATRRAGEALTFMVPTGRRGTPAQVQRNGVLSRRLSRVMAAWRNRCTNW